MELTPEQERRLLELAAARYPHEACGVITTDDVVHEITNVASEPREFFAFNADEFVQLAEQCGGLRGMQAIWHSHPNGRAHPSTTDIVSHVRGLDMVIVTPGTVYNHGAVT